MLFSLCIFSVNAQSNPDVIYKKLLIGESESIFLNSAWPGVAFHSVIGDPGVDSGESTLVLFNGDGNELILEAAPIENYIEWIFKYYVSVPNSNIPQVRYVYVQLETVESIVETERDYVLDNNSSNSIAVLDNDFANGDDLTLFQVVRNQEVSTTVLTDQIDITSLSTDNKMYAQYVAQDGIGTTDNSVVVLVPNEAPVESVSRDHYTTNKSNLEFTLPSNGFEFDDSFSDLTGSIEEIQEFAFNYIPVSDFVGQDTLRFNHVNGNNYTVYVNVLDKQYFNEFVKNDIVYVARNESIVFDVKSNDLESNIVITSSSADDVDELTHLGNGLFSYTAPENYLGTVNFEYTGVFLAEQQTAEIKIVVDDQEPISYFTYEFQTKENTPFIVEYEVPISNANWYVSQEPANGTLQILSEGETLSGDCYEVSGEDKIIYVPNEGYVGDDYFEIGYEPSTNNMIAYNLSCNINVSSSDDCNCVDDCVWKGDVDNNGVVELLDLFELGSHFGEVVLPRGNDVEGWVGQSSSDDSPAKYADINGDGIVAEDDITDFFDNYGKMHSFYRPSDLISSEYTILFDPQVSSIDSGELLRIDVILGDEFLPAIDVSGISFGMNVNPSVADSASMNVIYKNDSWFCHNDPTLALTQVPADGIIQTGVVNTSTNYGSGIGIIGTIEFIVEEDLDDIRLGEDQEYVIPITFEDIYIAGLNGEVYKLADQTIEVPFEVNAQNGDENYVFDPADLIVYPNPSSGNFNIFLNGPEHINEVNVFAASGHQILSQKGLNSDSYTLDLDAMNNGVYFLQIISENHSYTQKLQVLK